MQSYRHSLTWLLLVVFLFAQVMPVTAAGATVYQDPNSTPAAGSQPPVFTDNSSSAVLSTADQLSNYYFNQYKNSYDWDWLKTTNINFSAFSGNTPQWNINTFQPFGYSDDRSKFLFNSLESMRSMDKFGFLQAQYGTGNNTFNLGLGYRAMNPRHSKLYGFNLFYDVQAAIQGIGGYTPTGTHQRLGAGFEYFSGSMETRINGYYGVSSDVQVGALNTQTGAAAYQHVAPGFDISVGTDFSFWNAPWFKLTATGNYYAQTQGGTINGYQGSPLNANLTAQLQLTPQLSITGGGTVGNGGQSNANVGFQFNLLAPPVPALLLADPTTNKLAETDISYKMLQPVLRNNTITVEQYTKKTTGPTGNFTATVLDSDGNPVVGATVVWNQPVPTAAVGDNRTYITDQNGQCIIPGVDLTRMLNYEANLGPTSFPGSSPAGVTAANLPLPPFGSIMFDSSANIAQSGALITLYDPNGTKLFEYDPTAPGNLVGGNVVVRGLEPGIVVTAVYTAPSGASIELNPNKIMTVSTAPAVNDATVTVIDEATTTQIAAASVAKGGVNARVFYSDGSTPLSGVTATLTPQAAGGTAMDATTGTNGVAVFPVADIGKYKLAFSDTSIAEVAIELTTDAPVYKNDFKSATSAPATLGKITISAITYGDGSQLNNGANVVLNGPVGAGFTPRSAGYYSGQSIVFDRVPYGTYTLKAAPAQGDTGADVTTSKPLTLADGSTSIQTAGTLAAATNPALGSVTVTYTANGAAVAPGTLVAATQSLDASIPASPLGNSNVKVFKNLTPGEWYFVMGTSTAGGTAIKGIYAKQFTVVDGATQTLTVDGDYKIATVGAFSGTTPGANLTVNISPSLNDTALTGANGIATVALWKQSSTVAKFTGDYNLAIMNGGYQGTGTIANAATSASIALSSGTTTVYGEIFDARTKEHIVGAALVSLTQTGGGSRTIDSYSGSYAAPISAGVWTATISAQGYTDAKATFTVIAGQPNQQREIYLVPTSSASGSISGTIKSAGGATVSSGSVTLSFNTIDQVMKTFTLGAGGSYTFTDLPSGAYIVSAVSGDGAAGKLPVQLPSGQAVTAVDIWLQPVGQVNFNVTADGLTNQLPWTLNLSSAGVARPMTLYGNSSTTATLPDGIYDVTVTPPTGYTANVTPGTFTIANGNIVACSIHFTVNAGSRAIITPTTPITAANLTFNALGAYDSSTQTSQRFDNNRTITFDAAQGASVDYVVQMYNDAGSAMADLGTARQLIQPGNNNVLIPLTAGALAVQNVFWKDGTPLSTTQRLATFVNVKFNGATLHDTASLSEMLGNTFLLAIGGYTMTLTDGTVVTTDQAGTNSVVGVGSGQTAQPSLYIQKASPTNGSISGTISGTTNSTATPVTITLDAGAGATTVEWDAAGTTYTITNVTPGDRSLTIAKDGYTTTTVMPVAVTVTSGAKATVATIPFTALPGKITGTLSGAADGDYSNVIFTLVQGETPITFTPVITGSSYTLSNVAAGTQYSLYASKSGYDNTTGPQVLNVVAGQTTTITEPIVFTLIPGPVGGTISGLISSETTKAPIQGATVTLYIAGSTTQFKQQETGIAGTYDFSQLADGSYTVAVTAANYVTQTSGTLIIAKASTIVQNFALLAPVTTGSITGSISGTTNATIALDSGAGTTAVTWDATGTIYTISNVTPGDRSLTISKDGYSTITPMPIPVVVTVGAITTVATTPVFTANPGTVSGTVTLSDGATPVAATVTLTNQVAGSVAQIMTTAVNGTYSFTAVTPGTYSITMTKTGYSSPTFANFDVATGATVTKDATLTALPGYISGTLNGVASGDYSDVTFTLVQGSTPITFTPVITGSSYTLSNVAAGTQYSLYASKSGYDNTTGPQVLNVVAGQTTTITEPIVFTLIPGPVGGDINGLISSAVTKDPISGATVTLYIAGSTTPLKQQDTGISGIYDFSGLADGSYTVTVSATNYATQTSGTLIISNSSTIAQNFSLTPPVIITGSISGTTYASDGVTPLGGVNVTIAPPSTTGRAAITVVSGTTTGVYTASGLILDTYAVSAKKPGYVDSAVQSVILSSASPDATGKNFSLIPAPVATGSISGKTLDENGSIVGGASIRLWIGQDPVGTPTTSDAATGEYAFTNLAIAHYQVRADKTSANLYGMIDAPLETMTDPNIVSPAGNIHMMPPVPPSNNLQVIPEGNLPTDVTWTLVVTNTTTGTKIISNPMTGPTGYGTILTNGNYSVSVENLATPYTAVVSTQLQSFTIADGTATSGTITFSSPTTTGSISGTMSGAANGDYSNVIFTLTQGSTPVTFTTAITGSSYTLSNVAPGTSYSLYASKAGYYNSTGPQILNVVANQTTTITQPIVFTIPVPVGGDINGLISSAVTKEAIQGATVTLYVAGSTTPFRQQDTGIAGIYDFSGLADGSYTVTVSAPNYATQTSGTLIISNSSTIAQNFSLTPPVIITGSISGTTYASDGVTPLGGVNVTIAPPSTTGRTAITVVSDTTTGVYTASGLILDTYAVSAKKPGYIDSAVQSVILSTSSPDATGKNFTMAPTPPVLGTITGSISGTDNATITLDTGAGTPIITWGTYGTSYTITNVTPGDRELTISKVGYITTTVMPIPVTVNPGATAAVAVVPFTTATGTVSGTATLSDGALPSGVTVTLTDTSGVVEPLTQTTTDSGTYSFTLVTPGTYSISFTKIGYISPAFTPFAVAAGATVTQNALLSAITGSISGTTFAADGVTPLGGVNVTIAPPSTTGRAEIIVISDATTGVYTASGLILDTYVVSAKKPGYIDSPVQSVILSTSSPDATGKNFSLTPAPVFGTITGSISGTTYATITLDAGAGTTTIAWDATATNYTISNVTPGSRSLTISKVGYITTTPMPIPVTVNPGAVATLAVVPFTTATGTVSGTITLSDSAMPINATVELTNIADSTKQTRTTDDKGTYSFTSVTPGTYSISVSKNGYNSATLAAFAVAAGATVVKNATLTAIPTTGSISGTLSGSADGNYSDVTFTLMMGQTVVTGTTTQITGSSYTISGIPASSSNYGLTAAKPGYSSPITWSGTVSAGQTTTGADFQFIPPVLNGTVSGTVMQNNGGATSPLSGAFVTLTNKNTLVVLPPQTTAADGTYSFTAVTPDTYLISMTKTGFNPSPTVAFPVTAGATAIQNATLTPISTTGSISGHITGVADHENVAATINGLSVTVTWLSTFDYTISNVQPGTRTLVLTKSGFSAAPSTQTVYVNAGGPTQAQQVGFTPPSGNTIRFDNLGSEVGTLDNTTIAAYDASTGSEVASLSYSNFRAAGYIITLPASGSYYLTAEDYSGVYVISNQNGQPTSFATSPSQYTGCSARKTVAVGSRTGVKSQSQIGSVTSRAYADMYGDRVYLFADIAPGTAQVTFDDGSTQARYITADNCQFVR